MINMALFSPYAGFSQEAGVIYLLANYVNSQGGTVSSLQCNGVFPCCGRDLDHGFKRSLVTCSGCMFESKELALWSSAVLYRLGSFIPAEVNKSIDDWFFQVPAEDLIDVEYSGCKLFEFCKSDLKDRFGILDRFDEDRLVIETLRSMLAACQKLIIGAGNFLAAVKPELICLSGGHDYLIQAFALLAKKNNLPLLSFVWDTAQRTVRVSKSGRSDSVSCEFLLSDIARVRADANTWPAELKLSIQNILSFAELEKESQQQEHKQVIGG